MDLLKHTDDIARAVASLNGFARRRVLKCKVCGERCTYYHISECLPLQQLEPVHFNIWSQMNIASLVGLKDNKVVTESIIVPATIIATTEALNRMIPHFTVLDEFACLSQASAIPPTSQGPTKRKPIPNTQAPSSPPLVESLLLPGSPKDTPPHWHKPRVRHPQSLNSILGDRPPHHLRMSPQPGAP